MITNKLPGVIHRNKLSIVGSKHALRGGALMSIHKRVGYF